MKTEIAKIVITQSAVDISNHGLLGLIVLFHVLAVCRHANKNLFLVRVESAVILKPRKEHVQQMHVQAGAIGDHGIVVQRHVGTLAPEDQNQVNYDIGVGKWPMDLKIVDQKRPNQVKESYADGSVLNYATKHKNVIAM